ncbi:MAG: bifunctional precorrin-2 dehydrogenase/sirohydrochlorin ferrochelatase [Vicinamibacterales bacterium]
MMKTELLPLFLNLAGRRVLLVGAGPVAASKLGALLAAGADVLVVAPDIRPEIAQAAAEAAHQRETDSAQATGRVTLARRAFAVSDLEGVWLVVSAATPEVNQRVATEAEARRLFVNAVDDPSNATAYLGGVVRRDGITLAISSRGDVPGLTGLLREALDAVLPRELRLWVDEARLQRVRWRRDGVPMAARRPLLLQALNVIYARRAREEAPCP